MTTSSETPAVRTTRMTWCAFDYRSVWRWHFYAGLIAIPFVMLLSITGGIYLFRPQIESFLDRSYDHLPDALPRQSPAAVVSAATDSVQGSTLNVYELPVEETDAARVLLNTPTGIQRVYVHPRTLVILNTIHEQSRPMRWIFRLHGELLMGNPGSYIVEVAASWAIVLIVTGLWLWWPRNQNGFGGVLYPRLRGGKRTLWRDLHGVTGFWISGLALILLLSGLPWAKFWGDYFRIVRVALNVGSARQDWVNGAAPAGDGMDMHAMHRMPGMKHDKPMLDGTALDRVVEVVTPLKLAAPVQVKPPAVGANWRVASMAANRPLRQELTLDAEGHVLTRSGFAEKALPDKVVGVGIAWHEGQLFGWINQFLGLIAALGLMLICVSAVVLWWKRRPLGVLGAPAAAEQRKGAGLLAVAIVGIGILLPLFAASLFIVWVLEALVLRRIAFTQRWLGLRPTVVAG